MKLSVNKEKKNEMDDGWIALFVYLPSREGKQNIEIVKKKNTCLPPFEGREINKR